MQMNFINVLLTSNSVSLSLTEVTLKIFWWREMAHWWLFERDGKEIMMISLVVFYKLPLKNLQEKG